MSGLNTLSKLDKTDVRGQDQEERYEHEKEEDGELDEAGFARFLNRVFFFFGAM